MKLKKFFIDNKEKILKFLKFSFVLLITWLLTIFTFLLGYNFRDNLDSCEETNKKELVNKRNLNSDNDVILDFAKDNYSVIYSALDLNNYSDSDYSYNYNYEYSFKIDSLDITFNSNDNSYYVNSSVFSNLYITQLRADSRQAKYSTIPAINNLSGIALDLVIPLGSNEQKDTINGLSFNMSVSNKPDMYLSNNNYFCTITLNVDIILIFDTYNLSKSVNVNLRYFLESNYFTSLNTSVFDSFDNYINYLSINSGAFYLFSSPYNSYFNNLHVNELYNEGFNNALEFLNGNFLSESNLEDLYFYFTDTNEYSYTDLVNDDFELNRFLKGNYLDIEYLRNYFNGGDFSGLVISSVNVSFKNYKLPIKDFTFSLNSFSPVKTYDLWLDNDNVSPINKVKISSNGDFYNYDLTDDFYSLEFFNDMFYDTNVKKLYIESSAYSKGFSNGLTEGKDIGYSNGYDDGLIDGKDIGYEEGFTDGKFENNAILKPFELMVKGVEPVITVLSSEIAPGITIGTIALIPLAVTMIVFLLKGLVM